MEHAEAYVLDLREQRREEGEGGSKQESSETKWGERGEESSAK